MQELSFEKQLILEKFKREIEGVPAIALRQLLVGMMRRAMIKDELIVEMMKKDLSGTLSFDAKAAISKIGLDSQGASDDS